MRRRAARDRDTGGVDCDEFALAPVARLSVLRSLSTGGGTHTAAYVGPVTGRRVNPVVLISRPNRSTRFYGLTVLARAACRCHCWHQCQWQWQQLSAPTVRRSGSSAALALQLWQCVTGMLDRH